MKFYCIDGNIGAGKTTILNELKSKGFCVFEEDLSQWGELLRRFYLDPKRWMCTLQTAILHSMNQQYTKLIDIEKSFGIEKNRDADPGPETIVFIERSPQSSMIFVKNGVKQGFLDNEEANVIKNIYNVLHWTPDKVFYLNTDLDVCYERMKKRGRECEKNVSKEYLQFIQTEYSNLYNKHNAIILENNNIQILIDQILEEVERSRTKSNEMILYPF